MNIYFKYKFRFLKASIFLQEDYCILWVLCQRKHDQIRMNDFQAFCACCKKWNRICILFLGDLLSSCISNRIYDLLICIFLGFLRGYLNVLLVDYPLRFSNLSLALKELFLIMIKTTLPCHLLNHFSISWSKQSRDFILQDFHKITCSQRKVYLRIAHCGSLRSKFDAGWWLTWWFSYYYSYWVWLFINFFNFLIFMKARISNAIPFQNIIS